MLVICSLGALCIGNEQNKGEVPSTSKKPTLENKSNPTSPHSPTRKKIRTAKYETEETAGLSTQELQRVVLLEQLEVGRLQKEVYTKLDKILDTKLDEILTQSNENITYMNL